MTFHIRRHEPLDAALRRIACEQIDRVFQDFADDSVSLETSVHSLRARCKKMRGLLKLPGPLMGEAFHVEDARFREAGKRLSVYRDAHIQQEIIARLGKHGAPTPASTVPPSVIERSLEDMRNARSAVAGWPLALEGFCDIAPGFARVYRRGRRAWARASEDASDVRLHRLRTWAKYHWYHIRILERLDKPVLRKRRSDLRMLGELLGQAHDIVITEAWLKKKDKPDRKLLKRAARAKHKLYDQALHFGAKVYKPSTDRLVAELARSWVKWRR